LSEKFALSFPLRYISISTSTQKCSKWSNQTSKSASDSQSA